MKIIIYNPNTKEWNDFINSLDCKMTENDKLLIAEARRIYKTGHWSSVSALEDKAETKTARKIIHSIAVRMYHNEEAACGII